ncbi:phytanoyl-CoA dioxygenase family protein [Falsiroseomonas tokyonensis]|uniref:Phytanoyl-CoA dioxygenase family protein n=1 Tax=Falsiroseomonas tokyonensis TaxID=430521 RepID=A0ABV7C0W4_9PROT|nr:phytanoyl-CoA dioxygenase family protein [Falsiroseomonas tokyonensis]MBU8540299.1 phytanoyl-CoA dioxygenase family protein [Falsiroseomonas tokyonensis]
MPNSLSAAQLQDFLRDGAICLANAFPAALAAECRALLWQQTGCDPDRPEGWTRPVVRLGPQAAAPFLASGNTPALHAAFDQLVGAGAWQRPGAIGTIPVRFPSAEDPGDTGLHIDSGFGWEDPDFLNWRSNLASRGRALLMLFLYSDVTEADAPTRLRLGSHLAMARRLAPAGEEGLTLRELDAGGWPEGHAEALATGRAGSVWLCHPFLVHAAQAHRGHAPRFVAQPALLPARPMDWRRDTSPVARSIRAALEDLSPSPALP